MKMVKCLLLGAVAAGLLAMSGANASDMTAKSIIGHRAAVSTDTVIDIGSTLDKGIMINTPFASPSRYQRAFLIEPVRRAPLIFAKAGGSPAKLACLLKLPEETS